MNEVFLMGKIITKIEFKFIINSKNNKSIAFFNLQTLDKQTIIVKAYNETADFVYKVFNNKDNVLIYGFLAGDKVELKFMETI